jgi:plastocyanin
MRWERLIVLTVLVVGVAVLGPGLWSPDVPVQAGQATVTIPGDFYTQAAITIKVGQTVTWVNKDTDKHTAVAVPGSPEAFTLPAYPGK